MRLFNPITYLREKCSCFTKRSYSSKFWTSPDIQRVQYKDTKPFIPCITTCKVVKVYDGDTITIASKLYPESPIYRFSVRLRGIDTPEIRADNENEKLHALAAKRFVESKTLNKIVMLNDVKTEKYGRLLADVYMEDGTHLNTLLIESGFAVEYDGGKKTIPSEWHDAPEWTDII